MEFAPWLYLAILAATPFVCYGADSESTQTSQDAGRAVQDALDELHGQYSEMKSVFSGLARQMMLQQFFLEEKVRTDGDSGIKVMRATIRGSQNYYSPSHASKNKFAAIHDHSDHKGTLGMGEFVAVMNGVEFRTRHNDYKLVMPSKSSKDFHATEPIPMPEVPPEVSNLKNISDQVEEMTEWFRAFAMQNTTHRDYRKYFKPILCYLEGAWTFEKKSITEPFQSDRHFLEAESWMELQEKVKYTSYCGSKTKNENLASLPTTIMYVNETTGLPTYAQWNYRILCHPSPEDIPLSNFKQVDDLAYRYPRDMGIDDLRKTRAARFRLWDKGEDGFTHASLIDRIFYSIPGKDNIPDNLTEYAFKETSYRGDVQGLEILNTGYYHRFIKYKRPTANGLDRIARGFNDENMWVAKTTQTRVAPVKIHTCPWVQMPSGKSQRVCSDKYVRYTWALPLEIVYTTPLQSWNPYNLEYRNDEGEVAMKGGRDGTTEAKALNGTFLKRYSRIPAEFYTSDRDFVAADTGEKFYYILDPEGTPRQVKMSGIKIILPDMGDVSRVRLRWPIAPIHGEGSSVWKEVNALRDLVEERYYQDKTPKTAHFEMRPAEGFNTAVHQHEFLVSYDVFIEIRDKAKEVYVTTTENAGHNHRLLIFYDRQKKIFKYKDCDGLTVCSDGHPNELNTNIALYVETMK